MSHRGIFNKTHLLSLVNTVPVQSHLEQGLPWFGVRASRYPWHSGHRPPSLSASRASAPPCLSTVFQFGSLLAPPMDAAVSILFSFLFLCSFLSHFCSCLYSVQCSFQVTVTSVLLPSFVSHRGLFNTNQRLSLTDHLSPLKPDLHTSPRYSTTPRNGNPANGNHLGICLSSPQKNGN